MADAADQAWYYADGTEQKGPVSEEELARLVAVGTVTPATLVWSSGMDSWQPYRVVSGDTITEQTGAEQVTCSVCGKAVPKDGVIVYDNHQVCGECKPAFVQRLKEGAHLHSMLDYAGFWIRVGATLIDNVVTTIASYAIILPLNLALLGSLSYQGGLGPMFVVSMAIAYLIPLTIGLLYYVLMVGKYGATVGKMACGLRIVRPDGSPVSYGLACGRCFANMLSRLTLCIGYLMVAIDTQEHRALHDRICNTRVIRNQRR